MTDGERVALAGTSIAFDIIIIVLPLPIIVKLQLPKRKKVGFKLSCSMVRP